MRCFKCESDNIQIASDKVRRCLDCGAHNGIFGEPMTLERAKEMRMPFGKYKGFTLAQVAQIDLGYVIWFRNEIDNRDVVDAINMVTREWVTKKKGQDNGN